MYLCFIYLAQIQLDELDVLATVEEASGKIAPGEDAQSAEGEARDQSEAKDHSRQDDEADQQGADVAALAEPGVLVPGNVGVIVHETDERLGSLRRNGSSDDGKQRPA